MQPVDRARDRRQVPVSPLKTRPRISTDRPVDGPRTRGYKCGLLLRPVDARSVRFPLLLLLFFFQEREIGKGARLEAENRTRGEKRPTRGFSRPIRGNTDTTCGGHCLRDQWVRIGMTYQPRLRRNAYTNPCGEKVGRRPIGAETTAPGPAPPSAGRSRQRFIRGGYGGNEHQDEPPPGRGGYCGWPAATVSGIASVGPTAKRPNSRIFAIDSAQR